MWQFWLSHGYNVWNIYFIVTKILLYVNVFIGRSFHPFLSSFIQHRQHYTRSTKRNIPESPKYATKTRYVHTIVSYSFYWTTQRLFTSFALLLVRDVGSFFAKKILKKKSSSKWKLKSSSTFFFHFSSVNKPYTSSIHAAESESEAETVVKQIQWRKV